MPPALSYRLIDDKNAELDNLAQRLEDVKARVKDVALQLSQNGNVEEAVNMVCIGCTQAFFKIVCCIVRISGLFCHHWQHV